MSSRSGSTSLTSLPNPDGEVELDYIVGEGAYGKVHRGLLVQSGETVAVKVVHLSGVSLVGSRTHTVYQTYTVNL